MKPFDPRLVRYAATARRQLVIAAAIGVVNAVLTIAQAFLLAQVIVRGMGGQTLSTPLLVLAAIVIARALVAWGNDVAAHRAVAGVKSDLRRAMLHAVARLGPDWIASRDTGEITLMATRGIDALDDYFSRYLPALMLAACVPVAVIAVVFTQDFTAALIITCTVPLIPLFAALIGIATARKAKRNWVAMTTLAGHFLDVVQGLATLVAFRRAKAQSETIRKATDELRQSTMGTLRLAFLSSTALELVATVSVALVAVSVGLRLVHGGIELYPALIVLVLAPEAYWPLRRVGAEFHSAADGLAAGEKIFQILEAAERLSANDRHIQVADQPIVVRCEGLAVTNRLDPVDFTIHPHKITALAGPSGAGKSTVFNVLLGFIDPNAGVVHVGGVALNKLSIEQWRSRIAWVPQQPWLTHGNVIDNVRLAVPQATDEHIQQVLNRVGLAGLADRQLGENGAGLSAGQRQRIALARALLRCESNQNMLVLLDEPTSYLDADTEQIIVAIVKEIARDHTVLLVAHRLTLLEIADHIVPIGHASADGFSAASKAQTSSAAGVLESAVSP